jgi:quercetin dioxygenase-like cupin family protein
MQAYQYIDLLQQQGAGGSPYLEFLRVDSLSMGLYVLPAGAVDGQQPHTEDEVYYVAAGQGRFYAGDDHRAVGPGDILFVPAHVDHRFYDITQDLHIFVFFAPAEYSQKPT